MNKTVVTLDAVCLQNVGILRRNLDRLGEILKRERFGVIPPVLSFCNVLSDKIVG